MSSPSLPPQQPAKLRISFKRIARIAGWSRMPPFLIGFGRSNASPRYPVLIVRGQQDAASVCNGLNHRFANEPICPRFGWLRASTFPEPERLDIEVGIREAQTGRLGMEAAEAIHSLAPKAQEFAETLREMLERGDIPGLNSEDPAAETCYVFVRFFPGLCEPCPLDNYVVLADAEVETAMEKDAQEWAKDNWERVEEEIRKRRARVSLAPCRRELPQEVPDDAPFIEMLRIEQEEKRLLAEASPVTPPASNPPMTTTKPVPPGAPQAAACLEDQADGSQLAGSKATEIARQVDTTVDKKKLSSPKKRGLTPAARQCAKRYKAKRKAGQETTIKAVICDYLDEHPDAKESTIRRSLSANPEEWKVDTKVDKAL